jgi:hypothetical protein
MYHSIAKLFMPIMLGAAAHVKSHQFSLYLIQPFHSYPCYLCPLQSSILKCPNLTKLIPHLAPPKKTTLQVLLLLGVWFTFFDFFPDHGGSNDGGE